MTYVYLNPADYVLKKPISYEEYAQLVENANAAHQAAVLAAALIVLRDGETLAYTNSSGLQIKLLLRGCGGGGAGSKGGADNFGSGGGNDGADGADAYECEGIVTLEDGETCTFTAGEGGTRGTGGGSPPGASSNSTAVLSTGGTGTLTFKSGTSANGVTPGTQQNPTATGATEVISFWAKTNLQPGASGGVGRRGRGYVDSGNESEDGGPGLLIIQRMSQAL